jgi:hypothetical protein
LLSIAHIGELIRKHCLSYQKVANLLTKAETATFAITKSFSFLSNASVPLIFLEKASSEAANTGKYPSKGFIQWTFGPFNLFILTKPQNSPYIADL